MNSTQDLILGVLGTKWCGFKYPGVEAYLVSIERSGFRGRKIMIVFDIRPEVREKLIEYGFELIDVPSPRDPFFHARMRLAWEYLKNHQKEFRYIFWLDIKDLVLQSDPSVWMEQNIGSDSIIGSTECVTIQQEETNQIWARAILGEDKYKEIKDTEVINGGTWAGVSEAMTEVFHAVHLMIYSYQGPYPPCQIAINYILRSKAFIDRLRIPRWSEGFASCLHPMWWSGARAKCRPYLRDSPPVLDINTALLYPGTKSDPRNHSVSFNDSWGKDKSLSVVPSTDPQYGVECVVFPKNNPFAIVHGYDRDWALKSLFEFKYRFEGDFDLQEFKENQEHKASLVLQPKRLRRPNGECSVPSSSTSNKRQPFVRII
jgi:hypothetical protein